jgi:hypothetical protein
MALAAVRAIEATALEDHADSVEDLAEWTGAVGAFGQRWVTELLYDFEVGTALGATVLVGGHRSL